MPVIPQPHSRFVACDLPVRLRRSSKAGSPANFFSHLSAPLEGKEDWFVQALSYRQSLVDVLRDPLSFVHVRQVLDMDAVRYLCNIVLNLAPN